MKKKYLVIGSLVFMSLGGKSQTRQDTTTRVVDKVSIEAVYNHYIQSGNNSAITGGIGTESLVVYGPSLQINKTGKNA